MPRNRSLSSANIENVKNICYFKIGDPQGKATYTNNTKFPFST